jgi:glycosyltransferase involved in cell wall biosynthesis
MKNYKVSIITTVRNEEQTIKILINSILKQSYNFSEFVINDNSSIDSTTNIIEEYMKLDDRIKLVKSANQSIGEGRNAAIEHSSGDILAVIDSGLSVPTNWLNDLVAPFLKDDTLDVAWGRVIFDTKSRIIRSTNIALSLVFLTKYPENKLDNSFVPSSAYRRRVWMKLNGFPIINLPVEDLLLMDVIKKNNFKNIYVPEATVYYYKYPENFYDVFKKWCISAYCSIAVKKSHRSFILQLVIYGLFFLSVFLVFIDLRAFALLGLYMFVFLSNKAFQNIPLAKIIFSNPAIFITMINLFFVLNLARVVGATKAIIDSLLGKIPKEKCKR